MQTTFQKLYEKYWNLYEQAPVEQPLQEIPQEVQPQTQNLPDPTDDIEQKPKKIASSGLIRVINYVIGATHVDRFEESNKVELENILNSANIEMIDKYLRKNVFDSVIMADIDNCRGGEGDGEVLKPYETSKYLLRAMKLIPKVLSKLDEDNGLRNKDYLGNGEDVTELEIKELLDVFESSFQDELAQDPTINYQP